MGDQRCIRGHDLNSSNCQETKLVSYSEKNQSPVQVREETTGVYQSGLMMTRQREEGERSSDGKLVDATARPWLFVPSHSCPHLCRETHLFPLSFAFVFLAFIKWKSFCISVVRLFVSISLRSLILAEWTVSSDSRSHCDDPYLTFCLFFSPLSPTHSFSICIFQKPPPPLDLCCFCSTFISFPHVSLSLFVLLSLLWIHTHLSQISPDGLLCVFAFVVFQDICVFVACCMCIYMPVCTFSFSVIVAVFAAASGTRSLKILK